jgi:hypothetical protein
MLKDVLWANSSRCREGPSVNLNNGLYRTKESRASAGHDHHVGFSSVAAAKAMGI